MCQPGSKLKFCTCDGSSKKDISIAPPDEKTELKIGQLIPQANTSYFWYLYKYIGTKKSTIMGNMITPSSMIGADLTKEYVIQQLNSEDCFDFDYTPVDGDYILIRPNTIDYFSEYLLVNYKNGKWTSGYFNTFRDILRLKKEGKVKLAPGEPSPVIEKKPLSFWEKVRQKFSRSKD